MRKPIFHAIGDPKRAEVTILTRQNRLSVKIGNKRQRSLYIDKGSIHQETITIKTLYTLIIRGPRYLNQVLAKLKEEIIKVGNVSIPLSTLDRASRKLITSAPT